jgi:hypothetical protein
MEPSKLKVPAEEFSDDEIARRRDEVIRRMAHTPPQPTKAKPPRRPRKAKKAGAARKGRAPGKS